MFLRSRMLRHHGNGSLRDLEDQPAGIASAKYASIQFRRAVPQDRRGVQEHLHQDKRSKGAGDAVASSQKY